MSVKGKVLISVLLAAIVSLSLFLGYKGFMRDHKTSWDENTYVFLGENLAHDPLSYSGLPLVGLFWEQGAKAPQYYYKPLFKHPPLYPYLVSLAYRILGSGVLAAFYVSLAAGASIVVLVYLIGREISGNAAGLLASFFAAIDPVRLICSEKMWPESTLAAFMLASLLFLIKAVKTDKVVFYAAAGVFSGLAALTKYPAFLLLPMGLNIMAIFSARGYFRRGKFLAWPLAAFLVFLPWLIWNFAVYGNGILADTAGIHGITATVARRIVYFALVAAALAAAVRITGGKLPQKIRFAALAGLLVWVFSRHYVFSAVSRAADMAAMPSCGWLSAMFAYEPPLFYIRRLIELSPLYLLSFAGILLLSKPKHDALYIYIPVFWTLGFFMLWGNYQTRYMLFAAALLLVAAAVAVCAACAGIRGSGIPRPAKVSLYALLSVLVSVCLLKTFYVIGAVVLVNDLAYF